MSVHAYSWKGYTRILIGVYFLVVLGFGLSLHWGYLSSLIDLGAFDQAIWGTLHGSFLLNTGHFGEPTSRLGMHFNPFLVAFVPLYALSPSPEWLILVKALVLSLSAWPIFLIASAVLGSDKAGFIWSLIYLANPFLLNASAWDFHAVFLAVPLIALAMLAVTRGDGRLLVISCLPMLFIQEQFGLTVAGFGVLWGLSQQSWRLALGLVVVGVAHTIVVLGVVVPAFSPTGEHVMLSAADQGGLSRYAWLGNSPTAMLSTLLFEPLSVLRTVLLDWWGWLYLALHLGLMLFLPLLKLAFLLPGVADLTANLLSATQMPRSGLAYHSAGLVPVFTVAAIHGLAKMRRYQRRYSLLQLSGLVLPACLVMGYQFAPYPLPGAANAWGPAHFFNPPDPVLSEVHVVVSGRTSVSVQGNVGAHFSQRENVYEFPTHVGTVDAIVLRLESPTTRVTPHRPEMLFTLANHLHMHPADYLASIECLLGDERYEVSFWQDPWLVFSKDANKTSQNTPGGLISRLAMLKQEWRIRPDDYRKGLQKCGKA